MTSLSFDVFEMLSLSALGAIVPVLLFGLVAIPLLRRYCAAPLNSDSETLNRLHSHKATTPTMGGLFVVSGLSLPLAVFSLRDLGYFGPALLLLFGLAVVGTLDDSLKVLHGGKGMSARGKLAGQIVIALLVTTLFYAFRLRAGDAQAPLLLPWREAGIPLGIWFVPWAALVIVASSNAVNLTDGLDGLASGCLLFAAAGMGAAACAARHVAPTPNAVPGLQLAGALAGAAAGFLVFNRHPAKVFLGDAGSLPLGGLLGYLAVTIQREAALLVIGGVFVAETLSVILQVLAYRASGKRLFRCAPLHHHFRFGGWSEETTVRWFWGTSIVCAAAGVAMAW